MSRSTAGPAAWLPVLTADGWLLLLATSLRNFAVSLVGVVLGLYLARLGLGPAAIGTVFALGLIGGAVLAMLVGAVADRVGRRRTLVAGAALMAVGGLAFGFTDQLWLLGLAAFVGGINPVGKEIGSFLAVEQAMLPQTTRARQRTAAFSLYSIVGTLASALGSLLAGLPALLGLEALAGYRALLLLYALAGGLLALLFTRLSAAVEAAPAPNRPLTGGRLARGPVGGLIGLHRSRGLVARYTAVSLLDAFGGGFVVYSIVAYWFSLRFGVDAAFLGPMLFATNLLNGLSMLAAAPIARRIGLLNTLALTQLPANLCLLLVPFMPSLELAVAAWLGRNLFSQIDVPTRQSYLMAIVAVDERSAASGLTVVARSVFTSIAPAFAGATLAVPALGLPFIVGGGLKLVYDVLMLALFRDVRPPEEQARPAAPAPAPGESAA